MYLKHACLFYCNQMVFEQVEVTLIKSQKKNKNPVAYDRKHKRLNQNKLILHAFLRTLSVYF